MAERVVRRQSQLVLGLDPDPALLWPHALELVGGVDVASAPPAVRAAQAVAAHCGLVIEAVAEHCVAVKPQLACFERLGAPGWTALEQVIAQARDAGLLVITDAKRGDIDLTARAARTAGGADATSTPPTSSSACGHRSAGSGSRPSTSCDCRPTTRPAKRSPKRSAVASAWVTCENVAAGAS